MLALIEKLIINHYIFYIWIFLFVGYSIWHQSQIDRLLAKSKVELGSLTKIVFFILPIKNNKYQIENDVWLKLKSRSSRYAKVCVVFFSYIILVISFYFLRLYI